MPPSLRSEHVLAAILSSTEDGLLSFSLDGKIQSWSAGAEELYGYAAAEMTGQPVTVLVPIYELPAYEEFLSAAKKGELRCCETAERLRKDRSKVEVALKRAAVRGETGEMTGIVETARAHRRRAEGAAADGQFRPLVEQMPAILWTTDQTLRLLPIGARGLAPRKSTPATWWAA